MVLRSTNFKIMGLDMYLYRKEKNDKHVDLGYWRKANHIHKWFVDNVQNGIDECQESVVSKEQLINLLEICQKVLEESTLVKGEIENGKQLIGGVWVPIMQDGLENKNPSLAEKLLPTQSGFFFGNTNYDEYYINDIKETISILKPVIATLDNLNETNSSKVYYRSSW